MSTTPNMGLLLPIVSATPGPEWAQDVNNAFDVVDAHDHTPGKGLPISSTALDIDSDLSMGGFNLTDLMSTVYVDQASPLSGAGSIYTSGGDLYYNNSSGIPVKITSGNFINAASIGGIGGDYIGSTASVFYTNLTKTFTFWQDSNISALMDVGPITTRPTTASANGIKITAPTGLAASYTLTLPSAVPVATSFVTMNTSGTLINRNLLTSGITGSEIASATITATNMAANSIANSSLQSMSVDAAKIQNNTITQTQVDTNFINSGLYTPSFVTLGGLSGPISVGQFQWLQIGNTVTVSGGLVIHVTNSSPFSFKLTLPVNGGSNFSQAEQASGVGTRQAAPRETLGIYAESGELYVHVEGVGPATDGRYILQWTYSVQP